MSEPGRVRSWVIKHYGALLLALCAVAYIATMIHLGTS
jgi:hypothetical protein